MFNRRGTGASDPAPLNATWEEFTEDVAAVLDAVGSRRAALYGSVDTAAIAVLFAAMHPERVTALILQDGFARAMKADDYPFGRSPEEISAVTEMLLTMWGTPELSRLSNPSRADDEEWLMHSAAISRASATPRAAAAYVQQANSLDVRHTLPLISVPTLVLHSREHYWLPIEHGRYLAEHIQGAKFVELPGGEFGLAGDSGSEIVNEIAEFLTGKRPVDVTRILATVMFTDIADSTSNLASMGDKRWRSVLDAHDQIVREQLGRFRGREINTTGDGFVASFDGPARAIRCAQEVSEAMRPLGIKVRAGVHTGECEVRGDDLSGLAVHIAARVEALAAPDEVLVSGTVRDLVAGSGIAFSERGEHELKGVPGSWKLFAVQP
jgi:class 3 adenylate cyclase